MYIVCVNVLYTCCLILAMRFTNKRHKNVYLNFYAPVVIDIGLAVEPEKALYRVSGEGGHHPVPQVGIPPLNLLPIILGHIATRPRKIYNSKQKRSMETFANISLHIQYFHYFYTFRNESTFNQSNDLHTVK